jgi:hypothetical protein
MQQLDIHVLNEIVGGMNTIPGSMIITAIVSTLICINGTQNK